MESKFLSQNQHNVLEFQSQTDIKFLKEKTAFTENQIFASCETNNLSSKITKSEINQDEQVIIYIQSEELNNFPPGTDLGVVIEQIEIGFSDKQNWRQVFDSLNVLRVFIKFYPTQVNNMFGKFGMNILDSIEGVQTCLVQISLILVKEVIGMADTVQLNEMIFVKFIPILHHKSMHELDFIKNEARFILDIVFTTCCWKCEPAYEISCQLCFDQNSYICQNSMQMIAHLVKNANIHFMNLQPNTIQILMKTLTQLLIAKRQIVNAYAFQICQLISKIIGWDNYSNMCANILTKDEQDLMFGQIQDLMGKNSKIKESFKDYRNQRRTELFNKGQTINSQGPFFPNTADKL